MSYNYRLKYIAHLEVGHFTTEEILAAKEKDSDVGACDSLVLISGLYPPDGGHSQALITMDGRTGGPLEMRDLWKAWFLLAAALAEDETLFSGKRMVCQAVVDAVRRITGISKEPT